MIKTIRSLDDVSTRYTRFEKNQVLTHEQLNEVARYADDQIRLGRVKLGGVGIACGLFPSLNAQGGARVSVTAGLGVTTDGDLLHLDQDAVFTRYIPYDQTFPAYQPFYRGGEVEGGMHRVFWLLPEAEDRDPRARPLQLFKEDTGLSLGELYAAFYMESYEKDSDLCSSTSCDNQGKAVLNTAKMMLVASDALPGLIHAAPEKRTDLRPIRMRRPVLNALVDRDSELMAAFQAACQPALEELGAAIKPLWSEANRHLQGVLDADMVKRWERSLDLLRRALGRRGYCYAFDHVADLADAVDELRALLVDRQAWCSDAVPSFSKHLVLGGLGAGALSARTGFFPSPAHGGAASGRARLAFQLERIDRMLGAFTPDGAGAAEIRVTPCAGPARPLGERAIPFYYKVPEDGGTSLHERWSWTLHQRGEDDLNLGYHAERYAKDAFVRDPLAFSLAPYPFFRVEGHVGKALADAKPGIEKQIQERNLPLSVIAVHVGSDRGKVILPFRPGYTDLHRLHHVLRRSVVRQLDEVEQFGGKLKTTVDHAIQAKILLPEASENENVDVVAVATSRSAQLSQHATSAKQRLGASFEGVKADRELSADLSGALQAAGELKYELGPVLRTEFATPVDALIAHPHLDLLGWLEDHIQDKEQKEKDRQADAMLLGSWLKTHPGAEHMGGAPRGGTLVLVYDGDGVVVADLALPYTCCAEPEEEAPLTDPPVRPPFKRPDIIQDRGVRVIPPRERYTKGLLEEFKKKEIEPKLDLSTQYLDLFSKSVDVIKASTGIVKPAAEVSLPEGAITDPDLVKPTRRLQDMESQIEKFRAMSAGASTEDEKKAYEARITKLSKAMAGDAAAIVKTTLASGGTVAEGSDAEKALELLARTEGATAGMTEAEAKEVQGLLREAVSAKKLNAELGTLVGAALKKRPR